ncbi:MAG: peptidoglycan DD-metalloendopeptidase family protein [Magnetospiraceae bacterium]
MALRRERNQTTGQKILTAIKRAFPDRQLMIRTGGKLRHLNIGTWPQFSVAVACVAFLGYTGVSTYMNLNHSTEIAGKEQALEEMEKDSAQLLKEVMVYRDQFTALAKELEAHNDVTKTLMGENATLKEDLGEAASKLSLVDQERQAVLMKQGKLANELARLRKRHASLTGSNENLNFDLQRSEGVLKAIERQRDEALEKNAALREKVKRLETAMATFQETELALVDRMNDLAENRVKTLETVLASTGLDLDAWLDKQDDGSSQGGPFVALEPTVDGDEYPIREALQTLDQQTERWEDLRKMVKLLPLHSPVENYRLSSSFGKRRDPKNKRWAMHFGVDLRADKGTPIYAPGPGKVIYSGTKGGYGNFVEISHAGGIVTRYGHMNSIDVKVGKVVKTGDKIGTIGTTGRTTGPHLHYELKIDGKPVDPYKFIKAGRYVFQG